LLKTLVTDGFSGNGNIGDHYRVRNLRRLHYPDYFLASLLRERGCGYPKHQARSEEDLRKWVFKRSENHRVRINSFKSEPRSGAFGTCRERHQLTAGVARYWHMPP